MANIFRREEGVKPLFPKGVLPFLHSTAGALDDLGELMELVSGELTDREVRGPLFCWDRVSIGEPVEYLDWGLVCKISRLQSMLDTHKENETMT